MKNLEKMDLKFNDGKEVYQLITGATLQDYCKKAKIPVIKGLHGILVSYDFRIHDGWDEDIEYMIFQDPDFDYVTNIEQIKSSPKKKTVTKKKTTKKKKTVTKKKPKFQEPTLSSKKKVSKKKVKKKITNELEWKEAHPPGTKLGTSCRKVVQYMGKAVLLKCVKNKKADYMPAVSNAWKQKWEPCKVCK